MQYREVTFTFPEEATDRDKVIMVLQSPYSFVRWCRTQVGIAPNCFSTDPPLCVLGEYLYSVAGVHTTVQPSYVYVLSKHGVNVITPAWAQRVIEYVDLQSNRATYNDVANMVMTAIQRGEIA